jgi:hypothetical protein
MSTLCSCSYREKREDTEQRLSCEAKKQDELDVAFFFSSSSKFLLFFLQNYLGKKNME